MCYTGSGNLQLFVLSSLILDHSPRAKGSLDAAVHKLTNPVSWKN